MKKTNELSIDVENVMYEIQRRMMRALDDAAETFLDRFSEEIMRQGVGKMKWREEVCEMLKVIEKQTYEDFIEVVAGLPDTKKLGRDVHAKASVVLFGNQADGPLYTKPGFDVYGDDISEESYHVSTATTARWLPDGWNMTADGEQMLENAIKNARVYFKDALENAWRSIPDDVFCGNVRVTGG